MGPMGKTITQLPCKSNILWIDCEKELPEQDGVYLVTSFPKSGNFGTAEYDGYGFKLDGSYRDVTHWSKCGKIEKKYGLVKNDHI